MMSEALIYYFRLQYLRFSRRCEELEVLPFLVLIIGLVIFAVGSAFLFYKTTLAQWIYPLIGISAIFSLSNKAKNEQLQSIFTTSVLKKIKLVENSLVALPFIAFLVYKTAWIPLAILLAGSILLSFSFTDRGTSFRIPTPFNKWPFEFIVGFRKTAPLIGILYFLVFKGIQVGNENLGYASLGFLFLLSMSYHAMPEDEYFAWIFNTSPKNFIWGKIKIALLCTIILAAPALLALLIAFSEMYLAALFVIGAGYIVIITIILAKYAAFPKEINVPQAIILGISFLFPPLLLYTIPSSYKKAVKQLEPILEC